MYVHYIEAENFRGLPKFSIHLNKNLNVFIGNNGVGKTSMIDLMTYMLSQYQILSDEIRLFKPSDIQNGKDTMSCRIISRLEKYDSYILAQYAIQGTAISMEYFENKSGRFDDQDRSFSPLQSLYAELQGEELPFTQNYPLIVSYPTNRAILEQGDP